MRPFLFWGTEIPASRIALLRKTEDLPRGMSQWPSAPPLQEAGLWPSQRAEFLNPALGLIAMRWPGFRGKNLVMVG
jgi:hypothetical protein